MKRTLKLGTQNIDLSAALKTGAGEATKMDCRPGGWMVIRDGAKQKRVFAQKSGKEAFIRTEQGFFFGAIVEKSAGTGAGKTDGQTFEAQFPSKITKVLVADGTKVKENDPVIRLEAMKMEFAMKAPTNGTVVRVLVKVGDQVHPGQKLVEFLEENHG